jgi:hypothetical protein
MQTGQDRCGAQQGTHNNGVISEHFVDRWITGQQCSQTARQIHQCGWPGASENEPGHSFRIRDIWQMNCPRRTMMFRALLKDSRDRSGGRDYRM